MAMNLGDLAPLALFLVVAGIVLSVGADILTQVQSGQTAASFAANASTNGLMGVDELASWQPTIGLVIAAAIVIGIVMTAFAFKGESTA